MFLHVLAFTLGAEAKAAQAVMTKGQPASITSDSSASSSTQGS
ncbi:hypothetical protein FVEN_g13206 [Fusarium venenatum]|nr:hypothetical protein FVEN_g13206 [Fusarium venenatum]